MGKPREVCLHDCGQVGLPFAGGESLRVKPPVIGAMDQGHHGVTIWKASNTPWCISCGFVRVALAKQAPGYIAGPWQGANMSIAFRLGRQEDRDAWPRTGGTR